MDIIPEAEVKRFGEVAVGSLFLTPMLGERTFCLKVADDPEDESAARYAAPLSPKPPEQKIYPPAELLSGIQPVVDFGSAFLIQADYTPETVYFAEEAKPPDGPCLILAPGATLIKINPGDSVKFDAAYANTKTGALSYEWPDGLGVFITRWRLFLSPQGIPIPDVLKRDPIIEHDFTGQVRR